MVRRRSTVRFRKGAPGPPPRSCPASSSYRSSRPGQRRSAAPSDWERRPDNTRASAAKRPARAPCRCNPADRRHPRGAGTANCGHVDQRAAAKRRENPLGLPGSSRPARLPLRLYPRAAQPFGNPPYQRVEEAKVPGTLKRIRAKMDCPCPRRPSGASLMLNVKPLSGVMLGAYAFEDCAPQFITRRDVPGQRGCAARSRR
jgi:hypothetical protein